MEFWADFGAEDEARLTPCKDDKPEDAEITLFKAGSGYYLSANLNRFVPFLKLYHITVFFSTLLYTKGDCYKP